MWKRRILVKVCVQYRVCTGSGNLPKGKMSVLVGFRRLPDVREDYTGGSGET